MSSTCDPGSGGPAVRAVGLSRVFGDFVAVDQVSFEVEPGEIFGFLGSNGAGKTTTIRMLCGLLRPSAGQACVAGHDVATEADRIKHRIGYMSQRFSLYSDLTVIENLRFWGGTYGLFGHRLEQRCTWALEMAGLVELRRALVQRLPAGFRQRLALGCSLLHEPPVVFLDEPTGGVDPEARRRFWDLIDSLSISGTTVFVTTHYMDEAERCHRVALMHGGRLLALDTVERLKAGLPGAVLEITCDLPARAVAQISMMDGVIDAALFGDRIHAVVRDDVEPALLAHHLAEAGQAGASVEPIRPSLEDVFIRVIGASTSGAPS